MTIFVQSLIIARMLSLGRVYVAERPDAESVSVAKLQHALPKNNLSEYQVACDTIAGARTEFG
jgi:hypothetical protein